MDYEGDYMQLCAVLSNNYLSVGMKREFLLAATPPSHGSVWIRCLILSLVIKQKTARQKPVRRQLDQISTLQRLCEANRPKPREGNRLREFEFRWRMSPVPKMLRCRTRPKRVPEARHRNDY